MWKAVSLKCMNKQAVRILGIDTSLRSTGVGIVEARGSELWRMAASATNPPFRIP